MKVVFVFLILSFLYVLTQAEEEKTKCLDKKKWQDKQIAAIRECRKNAGNKKDPDFKKKFSECKRKLDEECDKIKEDMQNNFTMDKFKAKIDEFLIANKESEAKQNKSKKKDEIYQMVQETYDELKDENGKIRDPELFKKKFKEKVATICSDSL